MPLTYLRDNYHKQAVTHIWESRRFESMYTLQGKIRPTCHMASTLSLCMVQGHMYLTRSMHSNPPRDTDGVGQSHCSREKGLLTQSTTHWLTDPWGPYLVSLLSQPMKQWRKPNICRRQATRLTGPISPTCDRYVQYLLTGVNPSVLNWHRQGLQPWRYRFYTYPLPYLPNQLSPLSPKGPTLSPF
jgi:hypothetical protein